MLLSGIKTLGNVCRVEGLLIFNILLQQLLLVTNDLCEEYINDCRFRTWTPTQLDLDKLGA